MNYLSSCLALLLLSVPVAAQEFDLDAYRRFLNDNTTLGAEGLQEMHGAGPFTTTARVDPAATLYLDSVDLHFNLTSYEKSLLARHGFMVTERLSYDNFGDALLSVYTKDLPVFVSTDAILHALHMSYDAILTSVEQRSLRPRLVSLLSSMHGELPALAQSYRSESEMGTMLRDVDLYVTVARRLLHAGEKIAIQPVYMENSAQIEEILKAVRDQAPLDVALFDKTFRKIDFSQFTPRGHYTDVEELRTYFQAMMWLGRTEIYLIPPQSDGLNPDDVDTRRQCIDAVLISELVDRSGAGKPLAQIDGAIRSFVGEQDNVTLDNIRALAAEAKIMKASDLLVPANFDRFRKALTDKPYAFQQINSQILMSDPFSPDQIRPASAFLLLGQRFIIDSYVTGNVVYDRIVADGTKMRRMLPSSMDVLFALGNDAAAQFLDADLRKYRYAPQLAGLRYLVDSYDDDFWHGSLYNNWLHAIRTLNPPDRRKELPRFMQTAAWWQQKMNTQLSSWAQLRHDNLLYAKQSYSGGVTCTYPYGMVEPIPEFYAAVRSFADNGAKKMKELEMESSNAYVVSYFDELGAVMDTLESIARKHIEGDELTAAETTFLRTMLFSRIVGCAPEYDGWYSRIFFTKSFGLSKRDFVVADIHTAPTDEDGGERGWVVHVGTGPVNMAVVTCTLPDGRPIAFTGPVMSYYEHTTGGYKRLTDEEWEKGLYEQSPSLRPALVNLYLAGKNGESRGENISLFSVDEVSGSGDEGNEPVAERALSSFPNPFSTGTTITFDIPPSLAFNEAELAVFDGQGNLVRTLVKDELPAGGFSIRWDGTTTGGAVVASGVYYYRLTVGDTQRSGSVTFVRAAR